MDNKILIKQFDSDTPTHIRIFNEDWQVWNANTSSFEDFAYQDSDQYISLSQKATNTRVFMATIPSDLPVGRYDILIYLDILDGDALKIVSQDLFQTIYWDGDKRITKTEYELSQIDDLSVSGVAFNLKEAIIQTWRRFFHRVSKDKNTNKIMTYDDAETTVLTTQDYTEGDIDIVEKAISTILPDPDYIVSGDITPDATGNYYFDGNDGAGHPTYKLDGENWFLWAYFDGVEDYEWIISQSVGTLGDVYWLSISSLPTSPYLGPYYPSPNYGGPEASGDAYVAEG